MKTTIRLAKPFFIIFKGENGIEREEAVRYLEFMPLPGSGDPFPGYQDVDDIMRRLDLDGRDLDETRAELSHCDIDFSIREAYLSAEYAARDYLWAAARRDQSEPCPVHVPTREERRESAFRQVREYLEQFPAEAAAEREKATEFISNHPDEAVRGQVAL